MFQELRIEEKRGKKKSQIFVVGEVTIVLKDTVALFSGILSEYIPRFRGEKRWRKM